ncbi:MAG: hypothetical protein V1928_04430 [Parcubacteria group bacterium]
MKNYREMTQAEINDTIESILTRSYSCDSDGEMKKMIKEAIKTELGFDGLIQITIKSVGSKRKEINVNLKKTYQELTDEEIKFIVRDVLDNYRYSAADDETVSEMVKKQITEELGYDGAPAVSCSSTRSEGMIMRMFSVMIFTPRGESLSI